MKILFPNTGVHFLELPYAVRHDRGLLHSVGVEHSDVLDLATGSWLPLCLDNFKRDYARVLWKPTQIAVGGKSEKFLQPIVAIDTKLGDRHDGHLEAVIDPGNTFSTSDPQTAIPDTDFVREWIEGLVQKKALSTQVDWFRATRQFYAAIQSDLDAGGPTLCHIKDEVDPADICLGGRFEFAAPQGDDIPVSIYLDLGNSRSLGVFYEDNPQAASFGAAVFPLQLQNYQRFSEDQVGSKAPNAIFSSQLEFRPSPFHELGSLESSTFAWPSMVALGEEATELATTPNPNQAETGISGPKRYLWDRAAFPSTWHFSTGEKKTSIGGEALRYYRSDDLYEPNSFWDQSFLIRPTPTFLEGR